MEISGKDRIRYIRAFSELLDSRFSIPGTRFRFGLDALIGLIPGLGDAVGGILSALVIYHSARLGVSRITLIRMAVNVLIEVAIGALPFLGDLFDAAWKANIRNADLLDAQLSSRTPTPSPAPLRQMGEAALLLAVVVTASVVYGAIGVLIMVRWAAG